MTKRLTTARRAGLLVTVAVLLAAAASWRASGGDWHNADQLACSDCHTMHNSSNGQPMRYDNDPQPAPTLLRHSSSYALCTYCHDGSNANAPDVIGPVSYVADPQAGFFPQDVVTRTANPNGHDLAALNPELPPGGTTAMTLTCVSCHAPHGNANYRNLVTDPAGTSANIAVAAYQAIKANGSNPAQVYVQSNVVPKSGMSDWCGACHGNFHGRTPSQEGTASPWLRHPQDQTLSTSAHVDYAYWTGAVANRVPVQNPTSNTIPSSSDQVFCLSCHKAHGSQNKAALIFADGATKLSTCEQCHNK
ncbi:MAG TPA: cytochrome c3 family protein [Thermoanaerobaculia bacterium]|nr:cytochrome c3 family protein [Thermoanaerobaculia bacterium]